MGFLDAPSISRAQGDKLYGARGRAFFGRPLQPVTNRFPILVTGILSDGVKTDSNTWLKYTILRPVESLTFLFSNLTDGTSSATPNNVTYRLGIKVNGAMSPVFFNGRRDGVCEPDGFLFTDPVGIPANAGDLIELHVRVLVNSGEKWVNNILTDNTISEGVLLGTSAADLTTSGSVTASRAFGVAPLTVLSTPAPGYARTLVGIGDSIMQQAHDTDGGVSGVSTLAWGFVRRYCNATNLPFINMGLIGDTAQGWATSNGRRYNPRWLLTSDAGTLICNFGTNDLVAGRTLAQVQGDLMTIWTTYSRLGIPVWQCTILPRATSTDSWATTGNQTPLASESIRTALNDWIRTKPSPLTGIVETADQVETSRNSGRWLSPVITDDGIHPLPAGHALLKTALDATNLAATLFV